MLAQLAMTELGILSGATSEGSMLSPSEATMRHLQNEKTMLDDAALQIGVNPQGSEHRLFAAVGAYVSLSSRVRCAMEGLAITPAHRQCLSRHGSSVEGVQPYKGDREATLGWGMSAPKSESMLWPKARVMLSWYLQS